MKLPLFFSSTMRNFVGCAAILHNMLSLGGLILIFVVSGCGYVSTSDYLSHIKTITISPIEIQDPDFTFDSAGNAHDEVVRNALINRFNQKWRDGSDARLDIIILDYDLRPYSYDANNQPEQFRMSLAIEYEFRDQKQNKIIDRRDNYVQIHDFYVVQGMGEPPETREEAQKRLIEELVDDFYSTLAEQW